MTHHALFIANNEYADKALRPLYGAERDAEELYQLFKRELGYQAEVLHAPSLDQVQEAVLALGRRVHAGDTVLFYFAGHGAERDNGQDQYLLLKQAQLRQLRSGRTAPAGVVSVNDLLLETDEWPDVARVFIFDACRVPLDATRGAAGAATAGVTPIFGSERLLNELAAARGAVYRYGRRKPEPTTGSAAAAQQPPDEGPRSPPPVFIKACLSSQEAREIPGLRRGIFSMALDEALQDARRQGHAVLTEAGLLGQVAQRMQRTAQRHGLPADQTPWMNDGAPEVRLFEPARVVTEPPPPPRPPTPPAPPAPPLQGLPELVDAFERQLAARQLDQPEDDCCVATLALMRHAGLGEAGLARYRQLLRQARQEAPPSPPTAPPPPPAGKPAWLKPVAASAGAIGAVALLALMVGDLLGKKEEAPVPAPAPAPAPALRAPAHAAASAAAPAASRTLQVGTPPAPALAAAKVPPALADPYPLVDGLPPERVKELQREAAARAGVGVEFADRLKDGREGPKLMVIPAGRFTMGSNTGEDDEKPPHPRRVDAFALMKTEVTVGQYLACVSAGGCREPEWREAGSQYHHQTGSNDLYRKFGAALTDANSPVVGVNWENARQYAAWLKGQTGRDYRLVSEAEWEYAARSGNTGRWSFGDDESRLGQHARFSGNSQNRIWAVGGLQPNAWGLHDMHGNVWEWVQDCWHGNYRGAPETGVAWETGCTDTRRVVRGGSWVNDPVGLRSAIRIWNAPDLRYINLGFRLARTL